ncbi:chromatin regulatory protein sir2 [Xylariomycetidae sp. FL0641]|nr:chromatin regulatory protein sir2 [Xylariomycetidae sp. FL0641]
MQPRRPVGRPRKTWSATTMDNKVDRRAKPRVRVEEVSDDQQVGHLTVTQPPLTELEERMNDIRDSWESESIFEDVIDSVPEDEGAIEGPDACTTEEAVHLRQQLRAIGPRDFIERNIDSGKYTVKKLLTAFGIRPPPFLDGMPDESYLSLLTLAFSRELAKRPKLLEFNSVDDAAALLKQSRNIIVLTGAGISTSLGIPDFRSKVDGLYSRLANAGLGINDPQEVFSLDVFREDPSIFYTVAKDILPATKRFSPTHAFIAMLQNKGKLLTNYSQNIDNIEANAGIRKDKLVQCHGSFATATCQQCGHQVVGEAIFADVKAGRIPQCTECIKALRNKGALKRKRTYKSSSARRNRRWTPNDYDDDDDDGSDDIPGAGIMKPDITFFGEALPDEFSKRLIEHDRDIVDLVIVIGTSLKVAPVSEVVPYLSPHVPQIYISKTPVSHHNFDIDLLGDCDVVVAELCRRAGWDLDHEMVDPAQQLEIQREPGYQSRHRFQVVKPDGYEAKAAATTTTTTTTTPRVQDPAPPPPPPPYTANANGGNGRAYRASRGSS